MKKLLVFLLVLAMLIPMGGIVNAEEAVEKKPFFLHEWCGFKSEAQYSYQMLYLWSYTPEHGEDLRVTYPYKKTWDINEVAQNIKNVFGDRPDGAYYLNFDPVIVSFKKQREDVIFVDEGVATVQEWLHKFLPVYKAMGGKLDGLVCDAEFEDLYATYIHSRYAVKDPLIYHKIVSNPKYATDIRPKLEERGFKFYSPVTQETPEIYSIHPSAGSEYAQSKQIWDAVLRSYINSKVTEACSVVWEYYPHVMVSDYQSKNIKSWNKEQSDFGGMVVSGGNYSTAGNSCNENFYSVRPYSFFENPSTSGPAYNVVPRYNRAQFIERPFNYFLYETNLFKNSYLSAEGMDVSWWISHYMYNTREKSLSRTPYYAETILHMGMLNPSSFMGYLINTEMPDEAHFELSIQIADDIMVELNRVLGAADRKPIDVMPYWNESYVLSGMYAGGKNYYRITPDRDEISLEAFKVNAADPTFSVNGVTVAFPGGKIIETGNVREVGTYGYWVETAPEVKPVITKCADYYKTYPAYLEDYEDYEIGTEYNFKTALPAACWEPKKSGGGTGTVVADPTDAANKMLALKGTYSLKNVNLPKNVTAGDTYAEHQAWEVTLVIPKDLAADAEINLLNAGGDKKVIKDGGALIKGGKLFYDNAGEYVELATLTPGAKYTVVRELDFTDLENSKSSYRLYDTAGKLLASAENVVNPKLEIPVPAISFGVSKVTGEAVLFDNFRLYQTQVGYDFDLFDTKTGMQVKDMAAARNADTTFRFSWMNTTQSEKTYSVVASYYNGETLVSEKVIKEMKLAPNTDGVEFGNVETVEGQTVRISLRDDNAAQTDAAKSNVRRTVIIIAAAVVAVAAVVVMLLIVKKKKTQEPAPKTHEE